MKKTEENNFQEITYEMQKDESKKQFGIIES